MKNSDRTISFILLGVCGVWIYLTLQIKNLNMPGAPGPRFFPLLVVGALAILSVALMVPTFKTSKGSSNNSSNNSRGQTPVAVAKKADNCNDDYVEPDPIPRRMIYSFIAIFLYVVATGLVGFYVSTVPFIIFILKGVMKAKKWLWTIVGTAIITGSIYVIFTLFFKLSLPRGSLW